MKKKSLLLILLMTLLAPWAVKAQETLTIYEGATGSSTYVPVYGTWADAYLKCEFVVPADQLSDMAGGTISQMDFAVKTVAQEAWTGTFQVFLMEVADASISSYYGPGSATVVYEGTLDATADPMSVEFTQDYTYGGDNLLVGVYQTVKGNWKGATFAGEAVTGACVQGYSSSSLDAITATQRNFIPTTTFTYEMPVTDCDKPTTLIIENITENSALINWFPGEGTFNAQYKKASASEWDDWIVNYSGGGGTLDGLDANTNYQVRVQKVCSSTSVSLWLSNSFKTADPCAVPTDLQITNVTASSATLTWKAGYQETSWTVKYKKSTETEWTEENVSGTPTITLTGLAGLTTYNVQVYNCENYVSGSFTTAVSFPYSQDFSASGIPTGWTQWTGLLSDVMTGTALTSTTYGWSNGAMNGVLDGSHAYSNIYGTSRKNWLVAPAIPMPAGARIAFDVAYTAYDGTAGNPETDGDDDKFVVLASTDNMVTWTILRQWDNAGSTYVLNDLTPTALSLSFDMSAYAGTNVNIAFYAESTLGNADNNIHVDNVVFELIPSCEKPTNVTVNYEGGTTATVSFNSDATSWNLDVNGTVTPITTNPYTIEGLELATTYNVKVQANCGGSTSEWSNTVSFTTDLCMPADMCEITLVLSDSYGDSWNGGKLEVVDDLTGTVLGTFTNVTNNSSTAPNEETYTLAVCNGRAINIVYTAGSYPTENTWVVTDINGEVICEHQGCNSGCNPTTGIQATYTVDCTVTTCRKPTDLAASEIGGRSVKLSWTENGEATAWVVAYANYGETKFTEVEASAKPYVLTGLSPETHYTVKVRPVCEVEKWSDEIDFTTDIACSAPKNLTVSDIQPYQATISWTGEASEYNLRYRELSAADFVTVTLYAEDVWQDGTGYQMLLDADANTYGTIIPETGGLTDGGDASAATYAEFEYKIPTNADGSMSTTNVLIDQSVSIQIPAGTYDWCITNPTPGDRIWIVSGNGNIPGRYDDYVFEAGKSYEFHVYYNSSTSGDAVDVTITDAKNGEPKADWTLIEGITSPYTLTPLEPETDYTVEVQSDCGGDGTSAWTSTNFSTPSNCGVPTPLDVTELEAHSATLNWTGVQENYQVQYRTAGSRELLFFEDFDGQPSTWTLTNSAYNRTSSATTDYLVFMGQGSTEAAYLITPDLTGTVSKGTVEFNQRVYNGTATFKVGFSSTTNDVEAFDWGSEVSAAPTMFTAYSVAMPAGTKYVAITTTTADSDCAVLINDFGIYGNEIPAGEWNTATVNNATTYAISSGLIAETKYEWQVRGINSSCTGGYTEWSELRNFTTPASCLVPTNLTVDNVTASSAELAWESTASVFDIYVNGDVIENVTDNPYTLTGLTPETTYNVAVRANCGGGDYSNWTTAVTFISGCGGAKTLPYAFSFETNDMVCWTTYSANTANSMGIMNAASSSIETVDGSDYVFLFSSYSSASAYDQYLISPELNGGTDAVGVEFYYRSFNGNGTGETFAVGYSTTTDDFDAFTWGDEISTITTTWTPFNAIFPAGTKYVAVHYYANYQYYLIVDAFSFTKPEEITWNVGEDWPSHTVPPAGDDVIIPDNTVIIIPAGCVANAGDITLPESSIIIIEDGGQLIHTNAVNATVEKDVAAYTAKDSDGWYLIATPVSSTETSVVAQGTYDLFKYNEPTAEWWVDHAITGQPANHTFTVMNRNTGYLYANAADIDLNFVGETQATNTEVTVDLSYTATLSTDVRGFNLMGNPFTRNLVLGDMKIGTEPLTTYYVVSTDHTGLTSVTSDAYQIKPGEGFFVQATAESQQLKFNAPSSKDELEFRYIKIVAGNENGYDNAFIQLEHGNTLRKMNIANKTSVYVMDNGDDYAATTIYELAGSMPVNFKATAEDVYTITISTKNIEASTMILIDNMTGDEIDLLATPSYTFKATPNDSYDRFRLIFDFNTYTGIDELFTNDIFAFQSGNEIYVKGEGELQVFDVMGRMVLNTRINGVERVNVPANAVYIFKLEEKTQKIVVR